jgi:hypothetical protein
VAALSAFALGLVVLFGKPDHPLDLLAGAALCTAFGFLIILLPERTL